MIFEVHKITTLDSLLHVSQQERLARFIDAATLSKGERATYLYAFQRMGERQEAILLFPTKQLKKDSIQLVFTKKRNYESSSIFESGKGATIAFTSFGHVSVLATNALLIEEAIRQYKSELLSFKETHHQLFVLPGLQNDGGNIYINWGEFSKSMPLDGLSKSSRNMVQRLCGSILFDFRQGKENLLLSGFGTDSVEQLTSVISDFYGQRPVPLQLISRLPDHFNYLLHFGLSDPEDWFKRQQVRRKDSLLIKSTRLLRDKYAFPETDLVSSIDNELALISNDEGEVLVVELKEVTKVARALARLNQAFAKENHLKVEPFSSYKISTLEGSSIGASLFFPLLDASDQFVYAIVDNLLLVSANEEAIKRMIAEMEADNTIKRSLTWQKFLANVQQESNVTLLLDGRNYFAGSDSIPTLMARSDHASLQLTRLDQNFYASAYVHFSDEKQEPLVRSRTGEAGNTAKVATRLFAVRNHESNQVECLYQDENNYLNLVGSDAARKWQLKLDSKMNDQVYQIDLLNNGKLQYLLSTASQLYVVDRLGRVVDGFPVATGVENTKYAVPVDYNSTKDYRFLVGSEAGTIGILNEGGKLLEGWAPKKTGVSLPVAPGYARLSRKDYFVVISTSGEVHLFNRKGEMGKGLPLATRLKPSGDWVEDGDKIVFCSEDGHLIAVSASGKLVNDEVLLKNESKATFGLSASVERNDFVVYRLDKGQLALFEKDGTLLFEMVNPASEKLTIDYCSSAKGQGIVVLFDEEQQLFFVVDKKGKNLLSQPMECSTKPGVAYDRNKRNFVIYYSHQGAVKSVILSAR